MGVVKTGEVELYFMGGLAISTLKIKAFSMHHLFLL